MPNAKSLWKSCGLVVSLVLAGCYTPELRTVGPGRQYATLRAAVAQAGSGDRIELAAGTYPDEFVTISVPLTIVGVGGMAHLTVSRPTRDDLLVVEDDVTIDRLEISGAPGSGIHHRGGELVVVDSHVHDNGGDGLLSSGAGTITIERSEFAHNGDGEGYTHNIYAGDRRLEKLTIANSYFHDADTGHEVKSRAPMTEIRDSRILNNPTGTASYCIDLPNGGRVVIEGNFIEKGPLATNHTAIVTFGVEGAVHFDNSLAVTGNTIVNHLPSPLVRAVWNKTDVDATIAGNRFFGLAPAQVANGPATQTDNMFLASDPPLDHSPPWSGPPGAAPAKTLRRPGG